MDLLIASFSIGLGAISSLAFRQIRKHRIMKMQPKKKTSKKDAYFDTNKTSSDVEMMKNELDSLEVERSIITSSVRKTHEFFREGKLSQLEFDRLAIKYAEDLRKCEEEIDQTRSIVDLYDLNSIKNNLVSIIEDKIKVIDTRLTELSKSNIKMPSRQPNQLLPDISDQELVNNSISGGNLDKSLRAEAEKIQNLESEISQALEKLDSFESRKSESISKLKTSSTEKDIEIDLESDSEQPTNNNVTNKKNPLRNFTS
ncbi:MAG TPA: hypothetical protein VJS91_00105 [Nitrososphaeraceae archaeon]|nr:hypothetical protein [Nitrososphaeraceae archaeon]